MSQKLHTTTGVLSRPAGEMALTLHVLDRDTIRYHHSLIPKSFNAHLPRHEPHITVVRPEKDHIRSPRFLEGYQGEHVEISYSTEIQKSGIYFWLPAYSVRLEEIRIELGLIVVNNSDLTPPEGFLKPFHITVAQTAPDEVSNT